MPTTSALATEAPRRSRSPLKAPFGRNLADFSLFAQVAPALLAELDASTPRRSAEKGRILYLPGDPASSVYALAEGRVKLSRLSDRGKELILDFVEPGECFGETAVLEDRPRETLAEAVEPASLLVLPASSFRRLLDAEPVLLLKLARGLGARQRRLERRLLGVVTKSAPRRLAELLLELGARYGVRRAGGGTLLRIRLSQSAIGSLLGVSREIVNHAFSDLKRRGVIEVTGGRVLLRDLDALAALAA